MGESFEDVFCCNCNINFVDVMKYLEWNSLRPLHQSIPNIWLDYILVITLGFKKQLLKFFFKANPPIFHFLY